MLNKSGGEVVVRDWACHIFGAESLRKACKIVKFCIEMRTAF